MALTSEQQERMGKDLLAQMAELQSKMGALGIVPKEKGPQMAPDGGPSSDAHRFLKAQLHPMITVMVDEDGTPREIKTREDWFDEKIHTRVHKVRERREVKTPQAPPIKLGTLTKDEMIVMTVPALMQQPEVALMDEKPADKGALVDAIMAVREAQVAG